MSSAPGRAGVAVIRVSGPLSADLIGRLGNKPCPKPRHAVRRDLSLNGTPIDRALVLYFKAPASFTGEDMAEFQVHGGRAVIRSLERALETLGARRAEPGEFSRRAFLNGKMDLTGAEALADLIAAESEAQQIQALNQAGGALAALYAGWAKRLLHGLAHVEASLDFADEDLPAGLLDSVKTDMAALAQEVDAHLGDARRGERLRNGFRVAVLGAPNAGKSSLINLLSERQAAIVSPIPGTTRDVIEVHLDLGGYPIILSDTAGLRDTDNAIEAEGIARAKAAAEAADITLLMFDATAERDRETLALIDDKCLIINNKIDLCEAVPSDGYALSTKTGLGIPALLEAVIDRLKEICGDLSRPVPTRERHRSHLLHTAEALSRFAGADSIDLAAEDLRIALRALGRITGRVDVEDLLDVIFRDFCIGK